ncbi:MAG: hypothetical protein HOC23_07285, partial [Halieaceae bacterium]|nr:hypothetical protein [Halieaceae bacterium]
GEILAAGLWLSLITAVATLSKENGALLPWLLAVVEVTLFRGQWRGARSRVLARVGWLLLGLPLLLMAMILIIRPEIFTSGYQLRDFDLVERLMTQARLLWHYLGWLLLPDITAMGFQHDDIPLSGGLLQPWTTLLALLAWVGLTAAALLLRRQYPMLLFALLVFAVGHVMESSVLALEMVFEHRNYLPSVGICLLIGWCLGSNRQWLGRLDARVPMGLAIGGLLTLLIIRCHTWSDDMLLARTNVVNHPDSARAQYMYSHALLKEFNELRADSHSAEQSRALMVAVRRHLLRMEEKTNEGVAAAAMLLYIDSNYFPGLPSPVDWFSVLENVFQHRVLQASDMAALTLALECAGTGACDVQSQRIDGLLDRLIRRNPNEVRLLLAKYQHLVNTEAPLTQRLVPLDRAATIAPGHASVQHYRIVERGRAGDVAGMYQVVGNWLAHDPDRRDLPLIKSMFEIPGQSP